MAVEEAELTAAVVELVAVVDSPVEARAAAVFPVEDFAVADSPVALAEVVFSVAPAEASSVDVPATAATAADTDMDGAMAMAAVGAMADGASVSVGATRITGYGWGYPYYDYCDPVFYNCGYDPSYDYGYTYAPQPAYPPPQSYAPPTSGPTVINEYNAPGYPQYQQQSYPPNGQNYAPQAQPYTQVYPQPAPSAAQSTVRRSVGTQPMLRAAPQFYLIAFTNHTIQTAVSFHVQGNTLYYTTRENVEKTAPLAAVDARFSQQINRDRHVDFQLPQHDTFALKAVVQ